MYGYLDERDYDYNAREDYYCELRAEHEDHWADVDHLEDFVGPHRPYDGDLNEDIPF